MVKLFVGGFPLDIKEMELAMLFGVYGDISTIKIVRDKKTRICKGYAFIEMTDRTSAENAAEALNGSLMNGKPLNVNISEEPIAVTAVLDPIPPSPARTPPYQKQGQSINSEKKKRPRRTLL
jgi:RNA recognition motif-containing protein